MEKSNVFVEGNLTESSGILSVFDTWSPSFLNLPSLYDKISFSNNLEESGTIIIFLIHSLALKQTTAIYQKKVNFNF